MHNRTDALWSSLKKIGRLTKTPMMLRAWSIRRLEMTVSMQNDALVEVVAQQRGVAKVKYKPCL